MDLLSAMRIFVRVVERGSLSAAARDLHLGQPTVSERIERLERQLGVRLLERTTRAVTTTEAGERFYERAKGAVEAADDALAAASAREGSLSGTLRVAAPHGLGEVTLPPLLIRFQAQHPQLAIDLTLNDRFVEPVVEGVDLSLRIGTVSDGHFVARRLGAIERVMLAAPAYLTRYAAPQTPEDLIAHPFIRISGLAPHNRLRLTAPNGAVIETPIRTAWQANHWRPLRDALLAGAGIGALHRTVCAAEIADGRLVPVLADYRFVPLDVHALHPASPHVPLKTRALLDMLTQHAEDLLGPTHSDMHRGWAKNMR
ncbi:LysR family transcriptional regulator [Bradyrhizobium sp. U87765 SZCCT0131]|nr:LysR family transcriptional regulator [Bradyrhizobium sp. U87765 SZCCT0131]MBR1262865.1 LysR family transcriptional regulator [Bradyrhizobium sp. U87765 SZCCT0134]MBR1307253.1 LysR family transcriptional regulator [Bradyrhizobium sp. U87765 SZCCT0110]MBR1322860.1 LysR family transcriptional regulator [Bradyrhizobium sp. U87765 SZCCT0109]MBR1346207.1 LysR family transcriptional regulator [Bradyrhizobium sp. U87765 SZCCT0048]